MTELKSVLYLYLGCEVIIESDNFKTGNKKDKIRSTIVECKSDGSFDCAGYSVSDIEDIKPLLRPLSDMSEEETIVLVKLSEWEQYGDNPHNRIYNCYKNTWGQTVVSWGESHREKNVPANKTHFTPAEFTYLLSIGIDLFQLIETSQALDKNKIK